LEEALIFGLRYPIAPKMEATDQLSTATPTVATAAGFEAIFKSHFRRLHAYACTLVRDEAIAEELVQQVFFKLWEKRDRINVQQSITAYLYRAVYNESINHMRHSKVKAAWQSHAMRQENHQESAAARTNLKELEERLRAALESLPDQCRIIFRMSRFGEMKYREIADELGLSLKTVENQMGKALRLLRVKLADFLPIIMSCLFFNQ
jgi:RNA polymerase sigma-70 factor (ECF subfamily)